MNGYGSQSRLSPTAFSVIQTHDEDRLADDVLRRAEEARRAFGVAPECVFAERRLLGHGAVFAAPLGKPSWYTGGAMRMLAALCPDPRLRRRGRGRTARVGADARAARGGARGDPHARPGAERGTAGAHQARPGRRRRPVLEHDPARGPAPARPPAAGGRTRRRPAAAPDRDRPGGRRRQAPARPADGGAEPDAHGADALAQGRATGRYLHGLGIGVDLAPVLDVPRLAVRVHLLARVLDRAGDGERERRRLRPGARRGRGRGDRQALPGARTARAQHRLRAGAGRRRRAPRSRRATSPRSGRRSRPACRS